MHSVSQGVVSLIKEENWVGWVCRISRASGQVSVRWRSWAVDHRRHR